jgi:hypothetical protein
MAHYAFLDSNNMVTEVIVGRDEWEIVDGVSDWEHAYSLVRGQTCKRTSYNNNIRKQYAGIGFFYNADADVFVAPKPFPSWILNENYDWKPPTPKPEGNFGWDEESISWVPLPDAG